MGLFTNKQNILWSSEDVLSQRYSREDVERARLHSENRAHFVCKNINIRRWNMKLILRFLKPHWKLCLITILVLILAPT